MKRFSILFFIYLVANCAQAQEQPNIIFASVRQFGLVESGAAKPSPGEVIIPFTKSAQLKELFDKMLAQAKARAMQKAQEGKK